MLTDSYRCKCRSIQEKHFDYFFFDKFKLKENNIQIWKQFHVNQMLFLLNVNFETQAIVKVSYKNLLYNKVFMEPDFGANGTVCT